MNERSSGMMSRSAGLAASSTVLPSVAVVADDEVVERRIRGLLADSDIPACEPADASVVVLACRAFRTVEAEQVMDLRKDSPAAAVLVVTGPDEATRVRQALTAGVSGFITDVESLPAAIAAVAAGHLCLPSAYRRQVAKPTFTTREKQILGLVVMGLSNGEIGRKLYLAESTVKSHLSSAFNKLGVRSRNDATAMILDPESGLGPGILRISEDMPGTRRLAVR